jgi:hypothetical protein
MSDLYEHGIAELMGGDIDLVNDQISIMLIDANYYTVDLATHTSQSDVPDAAILSQVIMTGKTLDGITFRASDVTFPSVEGEEASAVIIFKDTDSYVTSTLICYLDDAPEFPTTPNGTDIIITWDTGDNGIFKIGNPSP